MSAAQLARARELASQTTTRVMVSCVCVLLLIVGCGCQLVVAGYVVFGDPQGPLWIGFFAPIGFAFFLAAMMLAWPVAWLASSWWLALLGLAAFGLSSDFV